MFNFPFSLKMNTGFTHNLVFNCKKKVRGKELTRRKGKIRGEGDEEEEEKKMMKRKTITTKRDASQRTSIKGGCVVLFHVRRTALQCNEKNALQREITLRPLPLICKFMLETNYLCFSREEILTLTSWGDGVKKCGTVQEIG